MWGRMMWIGMSRAYTEMVRFSTFDTVIWWNCSGEEGLRCSIDRWRWIRYEYDPGLFEILFLNRCENNPVLPFRLTD